MKKLNIALLTGGDSSEREVALDSARQVYNALDKEKYNIFIIDVNRRNWTLVDENYKPITSIDKTDFSVTVSGRKTELEYAYIMIHGIPGEDGKLQGYFEIMGVPYSTCGFVSSVETFDKTICKKVVSGIEGLNLAREILLRKGDKIITEDIVKTLGLPVFVKPNASGSSCGITKVKHEKDIIPAIETAFKESSAVLIEEFISGREFGCGVLLTADEVITFPVTEIVSHKEFFDYEAKYTSGMSDEITPAQISSDTSERLKRLAILAAVACDCRGIVRIDFIVTEQRRIFMIEINSIPGMSSGSIVPKQIKAAGLTMTEVLDKVISDTLCRQ